MAIIYRRLILSWFIFMVFLFGSFSHKTQSNPCYCVVFNQNSDYFEVQSKQDSKFTGFKIVKKGFETIEKQKEAVNEFYSNQRATFPTFNVYYYSPDPPEVVQSLDEGTCEKVVTIEEFRAGNKYFREVFFVEEKSDHRYIVWRANLEPEE